MRHAPPYLTAIKRLKKASLRRLFCPHYNMLEWYFYVNDARFFLACRYPAAEVFFRAFIGGASTAAEGALRRLFRCRPSAVAVL